MKVEKVLGPVGQIIDIKKAHELGSEGSDPVAIIKHPWHGSTANAWIVIPEGQEAEIGDNVRMFKVREGNLTTHHFAKREE